MIDIAPAPKPIQVVKVRLATGHTITRYADLQTCAVAFALEEIMEFEGFERDEWFCDGPAEDSPDGWDEIIIRATGEVFGWCDSEIDVTPLMGTHERAAKLVPGDEIRRAA